MEFEAGESIIPPERIVLLLVSTKSVRHLILGLFLIQ